MRIVLVGGGSGGHFYPLIAVAEVLNEHEIKPELYYFGPTKFDKAALEAEHIKFVSCPAGKTRRYFSVKNFLDFFKNVVGLFTAIVKLYKVYPDVVFSKGGYTSVPVILAAKFLAIPIVIHESDSVPGRSSKIGAKLARYIGIAYDEAIPFFPKEKTALVGIPIRQAVRHQREKAEARQLLNIPNDRALVYVTGGSQGAERLNDQVLEALPELLKTMRVFHQVGNTHLESMKELLQTKMADTDLLENYYLQGYLDEQMIALILSAADLVVSRAGSTTIFETALHETPAILVPIPENISHDQRTNAYAYARDGAAIIIEEENMTEGVLIHEINRILTNGEDYQKMVAATRSMQYPDAANKLADILVSIGKEHGS